MSKIGIVGWKTSSDSFGASLPYLNYFSKFGKVKIIMPGDDIDLSLDLLVLPGGMDLNPSSYGEIPGFFTGNTDVFKQHFYDNYLEEYIKAEIPIFGICLGMQQLNCYFGGKLKQNMVYKPYSTNREDLVEELIVYKDALAMLDSAMKKYNIVGGNKKVNSLHHQCVGTLSKDFTIVAESKVYRNIEAIIHNSLPIAAVQWHPEELYYDWLADAMIHTLLMKNNENK